MDEAAQPELLSAQQLVDNLEESQVAELREAFDLFDKNGDKTISAKELRHVFKSMGQEHTEEQVRDMMNDVDQDQNGDIDFFEFCALMAKRVKEPEKKDEYAEAFKVFDRMANGTVDGVELI